MDATADIVTFVLDVTGAMGLDLQADIEETTDGPRINLAGEGGEVLVRRKGEALDALQHLVNAVFRTHAEDGRRVVVDCLQFRKNKDAELQQMARALTEKARTTGVAQEIGPLNPYERRIVHLAVANEPHAASESIGDAFLKTIIITARK